MEFGTLGVYEWPPYPPYPYGPGVLKVHENTPNEGKAYWFFNCPRAWLQGKWLRFFYGNEPVFFPEDTWAVKIYDGFYDRRSDTDFPDQAPLPLKGNGLLQTLTSDADWVIKDVQVDVSGGVEEYCTVFFEMWDSPTAYQGMWVDWVEINGAAAGADPQYRWDFYGSNFTPINMWERSGTYADYGFFGLNGSSDLKGKATILQPHVELKGKAELVRSRDLKCRAHILKCYDFSGSLGFSFYWWGSGKDEGVDLILHTPTGRFVAIFSDGPAAWRWIFLPWNAFTETGIDGSRPDKSRICGIFWVIHSSGIRRLDKVAAYRSLDLKGWAVIRRTTSIDLKGKAWIRGNDSIDLKGKAAIRKTSSKSLKGKASIARYADLKAKAEIGRGFADLKGMALIPQDMEALKAEAFIGEDLTDYIEVDGDTL